MVSEQLCWLVVLIECLLAHAVILISYVAILWQVRHSRALLAKYMDSQDTRSGGQAARLLRRYKVASRILLGLVILYLVCILPVALYNIIGQDGQWKELDILLYCLYWLQYMANTIIYVMSSTRSGGQAARLLRRYKVASRILLGLVILYLVCILPVALYNIIGQDGQWKELDILLYCLYWLRYMANTIIYVMSSTRYRMDLRVFLRGIFLCHTASNSSPHDWSHVGQLNLSLNLRDSVGLN